MDKPPTARAALRLAGTSPCGKAKGHKKKGALTGFNGDITI